jgi:hypothetical protein
MTINNVNGQHKHTASQIRDLTPAVNARVMKKVKGHHLSGSADIDASIAVHSAKHDPHPQYHLEAETVAKIVATLVAGSGINVSYSATTGKITVSLNAP